MGMGGDRSYESNTDKLSSPSSSSDEPSLVSPEVPGSSYVCDGSSGSSSNSPNPRDPDAISVSLFGAMNAVPSIIGTPAASSSYNHRLDPRISPSLPSRSTNTAIPPRMVDLPECLPTFSGAGS